MSEITVYNPEFGAMSVREFAQIARLGESSVWKAIREKRLTARKNGRRTLILRQEAEAYLNSLPRVGEAA
jgi:excisionase family DNA binding protein